MKKLLTALICCLVLYFSLAIIHSYFTEWTMPTKTHMVTHSITNNTTLAEIEKQTRKVAQKYLPNCYLGTIIFSATSEESFETLSNGNLELIYFKNIGDLYGFYTFERFAYCSIYVDLNQGCINKIKTYGNDQIGGTEKLNTFPEIVTIKNAFSDYYNHLFNKPFTINKGYIQVIQEDNITATFSLLLSDGTKKDIKGSVKLNSGKYYFEPLE